RHLLLPARRGDHGSVIHRRQRRAPGQDGPRRDRSAMRAAVLRGRGPAQRDAAWRRIRPAGAVGDPDRRGLPGHHPAVRGEAQPAGQGDALHPAGDHHHLAGVSITPYQATSVESSSQLASQVSNLNGMRLLDPDVVSSTFQQLQQVKSFYKFPDALSMDRYTFASGGSQPQDTVVAVRDMGGPPPGQGNWINTHLVYTHGFGVVAARANSTQGNGNPSFVESDVPPRGQLGLRQPRVYFGEQESAYAIVGGSSSGHKQELDYPSGNAGGQVNNTYQRGGGVPVGSLLSRALYAVKFRELNILISGAINSQSKILYDRQPLARVAKVAPFLTLDGNPYPVVAHGQIFWVV